MKTIIMFKMCLCVDPSRHNETKLMGLVTSVTGLPYITETLYLSKI